MVDHLHPPTKYVKRHALTILAPLSIKRYLRVVVDSVWMDGWMDGGTTIEFANALQRNPCG